MADVSNPWDTLASFRAKHAELASFARDIIITCESTHNTTHIIQCAECYRSLLAATRARFLPASSTEWFSNRPAFLHDLATLLSDVSYPPPPRTQHPLHAAKGLIWRERERYVRSLLAGSIAVKQFAEATIGEKAFGLRTDADIAADQWSLLADLRIAAVRRKEIRSRVVEKQVEQLEEAISKGDEEAKLGVLMDVLFGDGNGGGQGVESGKAVAPDTKDAQAALARLRAGQPLEAVLRAAVREREAVAVAGGREREKRTKRLLELRRGKAAHAAAEERKRKLRERERGGGKKHAELPEEFLENIPTCKHPACHNDISTAEARDGAGLICCEICLLEALVRYRPDPTYYCTEHVDRAFDKHVQTQHRSCAAPIATCVSEREGAAMPSWDNAVVCKECLLPTPASPGYILPEAMRVESIETPPGQVTIYCTADCAAADFKRHLSETHPSSTSLSVSKFGEELRKLKEEYGIGDDKVKRER